MFQTTHFFNTDNFIELQQQDGSELFTMVVRQEVLEEVSVLEIQILDAVTSP